MATQKERAIVFQQLHVPGDPLILFNIWDAGSAKALQEVGAKAIATGSWSVAAAHGSADREKLPLDLVVANVKRIAAAVDLPVTIDFESGYGKLPDEVQENTSKVLEAGAVGINFEDQIIGAAEGLYSIEDQCTRVKAIREMSDRLSIPFFINARTDIFLKADVATHNESHLEEAIQRAHAYADSGARGFFAAGLRKPEYIEKLCKQSPIPVNILMFPGSFTTRQLADLGVARISYGPFPYREMIAALKDAGAKAFSRREM
jgi:2-methylisocitrate lyase-like PEP mutase family enzyme